MESYWRDLKLKATEYWLWETCEGCQKFWGECGSTGLDNFFYLILNIPTTGRNIDYHNKVASSYLHKHIYFIIINYVCENQGKATSKSILICFLEVR